MSDFDSINNFLVDIWSRINKIEERLIAAGVGENISLTEIHIIEKAGAEQPSRMSSIAKAVGVTLATLTVACDKLESKGLVQRTRDTADKRVVNISLTPRGQAVYAYHKRFHERMTAAALHDLSDRETALLASSLQKLQSFFERQSMQ